MVAVVTAGILSGCTVFLLGYGHIATPLLGVTALLLGLGVLVRGHRHNHSGFLSIDLYAQRSRLLAVHPGLKVWAAVAAAILCVAASSVPVSLVLLLGMAAVTVGLGGTPFSYYFALLLTPMAFILLGALAIVVQISPHPLGLLDLSVAGWYLCVTPASQATALTVTARAMGAVSCLYMLSLTTPFHHILPVLRRAKVPGVAVDLMVLIYRYIFVLLETHRQMVVSAQSRLGYRDFPTSLRTFLVELRGLFFLSFRRASLCFSAMESRGYQGEILFLEQHIPLRRRDVAAVAGGGVLLGTVWLLSTMKGGML